MSRRMICAPAVWLVLAALATLAADAPAPADEGMWLVNKLPAAELKQKHSFEATPEWMEHVQKACVRIGAGGSGSFVSPDGLVMTNHHVASDAIGDLSDETHDYMRDGFYAATREAELKCPHMELTVLQEMREVTERVNAAVKPDMAPAEAFAVRKKVMAEIEKEAKDQTGLQPEVVTLYNGARYDLYLYKRYTDVRLVFAPEAGIAFFGGDLDNFEYPRFNLDVTFLRAYEDDKPARVKHHLKWSRDGATDGELIFVAGHPGRTQRLFTVDHLRFLRDVQIPLTLSCYNQREIALNQFMGRSAENARVGKEDLLGIQNSRKAFGGIIEGLLNPRLMGRKMEAEAALREFVNANPKRQAKYAEGWEKLNRALADVQSFYTEYFMLESRRASLGRYHDLARKLVRVAEEKRKPDGERLTEYRDANLPTLELDLFSEAPIYDELEQLRLSDGLVRLGRQLGGEHAAVAAAFGGMDAAGRAAALIAGTKLKDVAFRRKLYEGGTAAIAESKDAMIEFARRMDPMARALREKYEKTFESVEKEAYAMIANARFEKDGDRVYPDATFTLRLSIGTVAGFREGGQSIPATTDFAGLYARAEHHGHREPYDLPRRWAEGRDKLDLKTPFNFISTNDIIGGNSGSPMFNRDAEVTGLVFDGNLHSLIWDFQFDMEKGRAVGVHSRAIIEALRKLYGAGKLADEITGS